MIDRAMGRCEGLPTSLLDASLREEALALLLELIRTPSMNPPGNEDRIAEVIEAFLSRHGIEAERIPLEAGRSSIVARIQGSRQGSVVLCGHLDTVRADDAAWHAPPLEPRVEGGRVQGLGAADMKGGLVVMLLIARLVAERRLRPSHALTLVFTADEEGGYRGAETVARSGRLDDAKLLVILEPTDGEVYLGQKGELWIEVTFSGAEAHGSCPELGASAILSASAFCTTLTDAVSRLPEVPERGRTTLNIGTFHGGRRVNIVPDRASVSLDLRVVTREDRSRVLQLVERLADEAARSHGTSFTRRILHDSVPIISEAAHPAVRGFLARLAEVSNRSPNPRIAPYATDAVAIVPTLGIPVILFGPGHIAQAHRPDEYLALDSLFRTAEQLAHILDFSDESG